jgi:hypothetical protein
MSSVRGAALCSAHSAFDDHDESRSVEEEEEEEDVVELGLTGERCCGGVLSFFAYHCCAQ